MIKMLLLLMKKLMMLLALMLVLRQSHASLLMLIYMLMLLPNCPPPNIRSLGKQDVERPAPVLRPDSPLFSPVTIKLCRLMSEVWCIIHNYCFLLTYIPKQKLMAVLVVLEVLV